MNGSGIPVGGMEPVTTAILIATCTAIKDAIPPTNKVPNLSFALRAILIKHMIRATKTKIKKVAPTKPNSSPIIEKIKSDSLNGKNKYFCLLLNNPTPNNPPLPKAYNDWISWNPSPFGLAHGSIKAINLFTLYGSAIINAGTPKQAGILKVKKCFFEIPPINSIAIKVNPIHIVTLIFGSNIISKHNNPATIKDGNMYLNFLTSL